MKRLEHGITDWSINDRVVIDKGNWHSIRNSNRSIHAYPDDNYVNIAYGLMKHQIHGTVTEKFPPGYEVNVTFDNGTILQVKDNWIVSAEETVTENYR